MTQAWAKRLGLPAALTAAVLGTGIVALPPLRDAVSGQPLPEAVLESPLWQIILAPPAIAADLLTCNSLRQHFAWLGWLAALYGFWRWRSSRSRPARAWPREALVAGASVASLGAFLGWAVLWPRSPAALRSNHPDLVVIDFHSHTAHSWDGRRSFTAERHARWESAAGYDAAFVTDHNTAAGARAGLELNAARWRRGEKWFAALPGVEVSAHGAHVLLLGNAPEISWAGHAAGLPGLERLLKESRSRFDALAVMSLPEYWHHHPDRWETLADWGTAGFEIVSAAPRALDFPPEQRRRVVELCRRRDLLITGGSDNHGWGSTACVWNIMRLPGWTGLPPERRTAALLSRLKTAGFAGVRVVVRVRRDPAAGWLILLDPPLALWTGLRVLRPAQRLSLLLWLWLPAVWRLRNRP